MINGFIDFMIKDIYLLEQLLTVMDIVQFRLNEECALVINAKILKCLRAIQAAALGCILAVVAFLIKNKVAHIFPYLNVIFIAIFAYILMLIFSASIRCREIRIALKAIGRCTEEEDKE